MESVMSAIRNTVPISYFNKGMAGKIFSDVEKNGPKVVMKNNKAACVLLSPEDYVKFMDALNDAKLLALAEKRMAGGPHKTLSFEEMNKELGISEKDLADVEEDDFE